MFWRALWSELRVRLRRPFLAGATLVGLILTILLIVSVADKNLSPEAIPLRLVFPALLITVVWSAAAWQWLRAPRPEPAKMICQSCGFSLAGHQAQDGGRGAERCPECGADPEALTGKHTTARRIVLTIGGVMLGWALLCCLFAFGALALWSKF